MGGREEELGLNIVPSQGYTQTEATTGLDHLAGGAILSAVPLPHSGTLQEGTCGNTRNSKRIVSAKPG